MKQEELLEIDRSFSDYSKTKGVVRAFEKYLAEDAALLPNNNLPVVGKDKVLEFLAAGGNYEMTWVPENGRVSDSEDIGYTWGNWEMTINGSKEFGKYMDVWTKVNREWKVLVDMSNMNPQK